MKRTTLNLAILALTLATLGAGVLLQSDKRIPPRPLTAQTGPAEELPRSYMNDEPRHKMILTDEDRETYQALRARNAILSEIEYGAFKLVVVDEAASGGRAALQALPVAVRDDQNLIALNGHLLDTTRPDELYTRLPEDAWRGRMRAALQRAEAPPGGLYLVQFAGPVKDEWLARLEQTGVRVVSYVPSNAYVVRATDGSAPALAALPAATGLVQFVGDYEPAFRLSPRLQELRRMPGGAITDVTVQIIDGSDAAQTIQRLADLAVEFEAADEAPPYRNVRLRVHSSRLAEIAALDGVFAVEERSKRRKRDEMQGQILAGNFTGNGPAGPGYLGWLQSRGFSASQFGSLPSTWSTTPTRWPGTRTCPHRAWPFSSTPAARAARRAATAF